MTKSELSQLLHSIKGLAVNEGIASVDNTNASPRVAYWDYIWDDRLASGVAYDEVDTYQISFFANIPRHPALLELREKLRELDLHPRIYHEYIEDKREWHSYFSLEVVNDVI